MNIYSKCTMRKAKWQVSYQHSSRATARIAHNIEKVNLPQYCSLVNAYAASPYKVVIATHLLQELTVMPLHCKSVTSLVQV
jgi:hypothetical protein